MPSWLHPICLSLSGVLSCDSKLIVGNFATTNDVLHMQLVFMHSSSVESFDVELHGWIVGRTKKLNCGCGWGAHIRHVRYNYSHGAIRKGAYNPSEEWEKILFGVICCTVVDVICPFPLSRLSFDFIWWWNGGPSISWVTTLEDVTAPSQVRGVGSSSLLQTLQ